MLNVEKDPTSICFYPLPPFRSATFCLPNRFLSRRLPHIHEQTTPQQGMKQQPPEEIRPAWRNDGSSGEVVHPSLRGRAGGFNRGGVTAFTSKQHHRRASSGKASTANMTDDSNRSIGQSLQNSDHSTHAIRESNHVRDQSDGIEELQVVGRFEWRRSALSSASFSSSDSEVEGLATFDSNNASIGSRNSSENVLSGPHKAISPSCSESCSPFDISRGVPVEGTRFSGGGGGGDGGGGVSDRCG